MKRHKHHKYWADINDLLKKATDELSYTRWDLKGKLYICLAENSGFFSRR